MAGMTYEDAVIFAVTRFDATPCNESRGWYGTKPGCKRKEQPSTSKTTKFDPKKEVEKPGKLTDVQLKKRLKFIDSEIPKLAKKFNTLNPRKASEKTEFHATASNRRALEFERKQIAGELDSRSSIKAQKAKDQEAKKKKAAERKSYAEAAKKVKASDEIERKKDPLNAAVSDVENPMVQANIRRRLEERVKDGSITEDDLKLVFNAVGGSAQYKNAVTKGLQKSGIQITKNAQDDLEKAREERLRQKYGDEYVKQRQERLKNRQAEIERIQKAERK